MEELLLHGQQPSVDFDGGLGLWLFWFLFFFFFYGERGKLALVICYAAQNVALDHHAVPKPLEQPGLVLRCRDAAQNLYFPAAPVTE